MEISPLISVLYLSRRLPHKHPHFSQQMACSTPSDRANCRWGPLSLEDRHEPIYSPLWQRQSHSEGLLLISKDSFCLLLTHPLTSYELNRGSNLFSLQETPAGAGDTLFSLSVPHLPNRGRKMPLGWQGRFYTDSLNIPAALSFQDNSIGVNLVLSSPHVFVCKTANDFLVLTGIQISCFKYLLVLLFIQELPSAYDSSSMASIEKLVIRRAALTLQI